MPPTSGTRLKPNIAKPAQARIAVGRRSGGLASLIAASAAGTLSPAACPCRVRPASNAAGSRELATITAATENSTSPMIHMRRDSALGVRTATLSGCQEDRAVRIKASWVARCSSLGSRSRAGTPQRDSRLRDTEPQLPLPTRIKERSSSAGPWHWLRLLVACGSAASVPAPTASGPARQAHC